MKKILYLFFIFIISTSINANETMAKMIVEELNLSAASKAIMQWERVFSSAKKMKRYKIDKLNSKQQQLLKDYLINHAIDSDQPTVAGI